MEILGEAGKAWAALDAADRASYDELASAEKEKIEAESEAGTSGMNMSQTKQNVFRLRLMVADSFVEQVKRSALAIQGV